MYALTGRPFRSESIRISDEFDLLATSVFEFFQQS